jgi:hypothetical protein
MQILSKDQLHYIAKGQIHRQTLRNVINEALTKNPHRQNYIISSLPGLGKTYEMEKILQTLPNAPIVFNGDNGAYNYIVAIAPKPIPEIMIYFGMKPINGEFKV